MKKKILCLLLALLVINLSIPHVTWAATEGTCGAEDGESNVKWAFDDDSNTLTISGSGKMKDYSSITDTPWYKHNYVNKIYYVTILPNVTSIGNFAFKSCSVFSVDISESVTSIGDSAFFNTQLTSVDIPEGVTSIGDSAFSYTRLTSVTIPESVTSIGRSAFENCTSLESVDIPEGVTSIGDSAFSYTRLTSVTIPESVTSIGRSAFENCTSLESVDIPEGVTSIGAYAFDNCYISSVTIPESVTSIGDYAFYNCNRLTSVTIPSRVIYIGRSTFNDCDNLKTFFYEENLDIDIYDEVAKIAYKVNDQQDGPRTKVKLVSTSKDVTIECNAMGEGYEITENSTTSAPKKVTITHDLPDNWDKGDGENHWKVCKVCGTKEAAVHDWDDGIVNPKPTCTENGTKIFTCTICNATKKETIEAGHKFSPEWSSNDTHHWHECTDCGTDGTKVEHEFSGSWQHGSDKHWKECTVCGADGTKFEHTFKQKSDEDEHWEECTTCKREKNRKAHTFSEEWNNNNTYHWHECSVCHEKQNEGRHTFEQKSDEGKHWEECTTCKQKQNENDHTFSPAWSSDGTHHWHECTDCGAERDKEGHKSKWEHDNDEHWKVCSICKKETGRDSHDFSKKTIAAMEDKLGGTKYTCTCGYEYWKDFTRGNMATQTLMPEGEEIYLYCERNGLMVKAEVDVGGGKKLTVFLLDPLGVLKKNDSDVLGISVTYIKEGSARYDELMSQLDGDYPIEHINFFEVHPMVNGKTKEGAIDSVYMMYEIPEGWDESDLEMILVRDGDDQEFDEKVLEINGKKYLVMWKNHFSPYAMIDKLTDEERAALIAQQVESMDSTNSSGSTDNSKYLANQVKTGDNSKNMVLMFTTMLITSGLFLEVCIKKKRFCYKISTD